MNTFKKLCFSINACREVAEFAADKTWKEFYNKCERGDWLLWLFKRSNPNDLRKLTLAKAHCANTVRHLMQDKRSIRALDIAIKYGNGEASEEELFYITDAAYAAADAARHAAYAVYSAADAESHAADAASHAAYAAYAAADAMEFEVYAAYSAADAAAYEVHSADRLELIENTRTEKLKLMADIVREHLPIEIWNINTEAE